jgi:CheY-like chemotaxis protein
MTNICILHVEDEENDVFLQHYAFGEAGIRNPIQVVTDGQQAIDYLVLLDLKLPRRSGLEVLHWIRQQPALGRLAVIILSSSQEPGDTERAYQLGANSFVTKALDLGQRVAMARALKAWWLQCNHFPETAQASLSPSHAPALSGSWAAFPE